MSAAKLERLLNLTALLLETPRPLSAVEGYRIPKDRYYLRDPGLTAEELAALRMAASVVQLDGLSAREGLLKLGGLVGEADGAMGVAVAALPGGHVGPLFGAIAARTPVRFTYRGVERRIDPYRLDFLRGRWYLTGFDHTRDDERAFRLDRFESAVERLDAPRFEPPSTAVPGVQFEPWQLGEGKPVTAKILVDAPQAPWIVQHLGPGAVAEERSDGSVVVTMTITNRDNFRSFVLTFLDHAEVLEPADLRAAVVEWLEAIAA